MSKKPRVERSIRMIVDEALHFDHPKLLGLKRPRAARDLDHRQWIAYGVQCSKEVLNHVYRYREYHSPLEDIEYFSRRRTLDPLPIPGGRGERMSSAILASKHLTADPIFIRRQQEENPFHPAKISHNADAELVFPGGRRLPRYFFSTPQVSLKDLADFDHPFEKKVIEMADTHYQLTASNVGKTRANTLLPFMTTRLLAQWLRNNSVRKR